MKNVKFIVAMLGLATLTPTFNSCKKENHCVETAIVKTVMLPSIEEANGDVMFKMGDKVVTKVKAGEKVTLNVMPKEGFRVESVKVNGKEVELPYEFVVGQEAPKVEVVIKKKLATIDLSKVMVENATVTFKMGDKLVTEAKEGEKVMLNVVAKEGFEVKSVKVDGKAVELPAEITLGTKVPMVEAVVEKMLATIDLSKLMIENTTVTFKKGDKVVTEAKEGEKVTLNVVAKEGFEVLSVKVDGKAVTLPAEITLGKVAPVLEADVKPAMLDLRGVTQPNVTINFKNGDFVVELARPGTSLVLEVLPNEGYTVESVTFDGKAVTVPYTFTLGAKLPVVEVVTKEKVVVKHTYGVVSLIGDAQPNHGWGKDKDYDLTKSKTEDYTWEAKGVRMTHHPNGSRSFKFRADHAWKAEWGGFTVTGTCEGVAHIKADGFGNAKVAEGSEGTYDITFNTQTLKYTFKKVGDL